MTSKNASMTFHSGKFIHFVSMMMINYLFIIESIIKAFIKPPDYGLLRNILLLMLHLLLYLAFLSNRIFSVIFMIAMKYKIAIVREPICVLFSPNDGLIYLKI